jgi:phosphoribosylformylglycinamidine cyclo-ligase
LEFASRPLLAIFASRRYHSTPRAAVAQLVEQRIRNAWVGGSNPFRGTSFLSPGWSSEIRDAHPLRSMRATETGARRLLKGHPVADDRSDKAREEAYKQTGVDIAEADSGLNRIVERVQNTWPKHGTGRVILPIGYYANVIEVDGIGMALCTDGVGSKTIIADLMRKYDTIGIDCVAMNVNDLICVGAKPLSLVDYIAIGKTDAAMLDAIGAGLCQGAEMAQVSISGGEIAQLRDVINGFDIVGMALGRVDLDKVIDGRNIAPGDVLIGVKSNGLHSNGYSLARRAFFDAGRFGIDQKFDELGSTLGEELLRPTSIYVREAMEILEKIRGVKALFNITGDGLLNLARAAAPVGYEIDKPIEPQPVFGLIQRYGGVSDAEMFEVFNMGIGFCYVVDPAAVEATVAILKKHGRDARPIGHTVSDPEKKVRIPGRNLVGRHKKFWKEDRAARRAG